VRRPSQPPIARLGELEQEVLLAVLRMGEEGYGAALLELLEERAGRRLSRGALYTTLDRLEAKRLVRSRLADASAERGGRPRRYFALTAAGLVALRASRRRLVALWHGLESKLGEGV
jgi:DNA-binding PadR family transcriptional regulator